VGSKTGVLAWLGVALVGLIVVVVVVGLQLFPRLNAAQSLINDARPAFTADRVAGDKAAVAMVSKTVGAFDPVVTAKGGAAAEVPKLVAFVSKQSGLPPAAVQAALRRNFPHTSGLLTALPLSSVSAELPKLVSFLATTLKTTAAKVETAIKVNFPHLYQAIENLPATTGGWDSVPGLTLTAFDGSPVTSVDQIQNYFAHDVIPAVDRQQAHFRALDSRGGVSFLAPLLLAVGIVVIVFGLLMAYVTTKGGLGGIVATGWVVVTVVGLIVVVLVLGLSLFPRLSGGQKLLNDLRPAFTAERVAGDRVAVNMISTAVDTVDPVLTAKGGAAAEVPKLVAFVSKQSGLSPAAVQAALRQNFPHVTGLLTALPLSSVSAELPKLVRFLATTLKTTPATVGAALKTSFPHLNQSVAYLPAVTGGWNRVPGLTLTRFDGAPVRTVPQVRDYFSSDVIPVLERQQAHFQKVDKTWPPLTVFAPLLLVVGVVVILYGLVMLRATLKSGA
jgi:hypothetical protein